MLGFSEIVVIVIVALIVLGPERLPATARTLGRTLGEMRRTFDELKRDIIMPAAEETAVQHRVELETAPDEDSRQQAGAPQADPDGQENGSSGK